MPPLPRLPYQHLCASFQRLSECIWDDLEAATRATLQRDEETITNDLLLDLWRLHPSDVIIVQFKKPQEARTGADWLWTLTDGTTWFSMLVQAKRLYQKTERYEKLGHSVGNPPREQIDILINTATHLRVSPAYIFYNFTNTQPSAPRVHWNCGSFPRTDRLFGCSVAEASAVKSILSSAGDGLSSISTVSFPFHCLACCPVRGPSLPTTAHGVLNTSRQIVLPMTDPGDTSSADGLTSNPPWWVRRVMDLTPEQRAAIAESIASDLPESLNGLVIVQERDRGGG